MGNFEFTNTMMDLEDLAESWSLVEENIGVEYHNEMNDFTDPQLNKFEFDDGGNRSADFSHDSPVL